MVELLIHFASLKPFSVIFGKYLSLLNQKLYFGERTTTAKRDRSEMLKVGGVNWY